MAKPLGSTSPKPSQNTSLDIFLFIYNSLVVTTDTTDIICIVSISIVTTVLIKIKTLSVRTFSPGFAEVLLKGFPNANYSPRKSLLDPESNSPSGICIR